MTEQHAKAVVDSINAMFKGSFFDICKVNDCMKVTGAVPNRDYDALRLYHCRYFSAMDRETKDFVFKAAVENVSNVDEFPAIKLVKPSEQVDAALSLESNKPTSLLKRLLKLS